MQDYERTIEELQAEVSRQRAIIDAWTQAHVVTCGCRYTRVWRRQTLEHWFVPCPEHDPKRLRKRLAESIAVLLESMEDIEAVVQILSDVSFR